MALDLGGTNYRLILVTFEEPLTPPIIDEELYVISKPLQVGTAREVNRIFKLITGIVVPIYCWDRQIVLAKSEYARQRA